MLKKVTLYAQPHIRDYLHLGIDRSCSMFNINRMIALLEYIILFYSMQIFNCYKDPQAIHATYYAGMLLSTYYAKNYAVIISRLGLSKSPPDSYEMDLKSTNVANYID